MSCLYRSLSLELHFTGGSLVKLAYRSKADTKITTSNVSIIIFCDGHKNIDFRLAIRVACIVMDAVYSVCVLVLRRHLR